MDQSSASLSPLSGSAADLWPLVRQWVHTGGDPLVVSTSGSTGEPKDVVLPHSAMLASATAALHRLGGPGRWVVTLPVTGVGGLQTLVRSAVADLPPVIGDITATRKAADELLYTSLVPTQLYRVARTGQLAELARFDAVLLGGARLDSQLAEQASDAGVNIVRTYGLTETCGGCVYNDEPLDGVQVRVVDDEIQLTGPMLFDRYLDATATAAAMDGPWFRTGDLGLFESGKLQVTGRRDDIVNSGGVKIALPAVTAAVQALPGVRDAIVLGRPSPEWGTEVVAFIVPDDAVCLLGTEVEAVRDGVETAGLSRTWAPRDVVLLDALPLLPGGKVDRQALLDERR